MNVNTQYSYTFVWYCISLYHNTYLSVSFLKILHLCLRLLNYTEYVTTGYDGTLHIFVVYLPGVSEMNDTGQSLDMFNLNVLKTTFGGDGGAFTCDFLIIAQGCERFYLFYAGSERRRDWYMKYMKNFDVWLHLDNLLVRLGLLFLERSINYQCFSSTYQLLLDILLLVNVIANRMCHGCWRGHGKHGCV